VGDGLLSNELRSVRETWRVRRGLESSSCCLARLAAAPVVALACAVDQEALEAMCDRCRTRRAIGGRGTRARAIGAARAGEGVVLSWTGERGRERARELLYLF
jgi:hypothetical protein